MKGTRRWYTALSVGEENWLFELPEEPLAEAWRLYREGRLREATAALERLEGEGKRYPSHRVPEAFFEAYPEGWARLRAFPRVPGKLDLAERRKVKGTLVLGLLEDGEALPVGLAVMKGEDVAEKLLLVYFPGEFLTLPEGDPSALATELD